MNSQWFTINKNTPFLIYGASKSRGHYTKERLFAAGFKKIVGYLDVNAKNIPQIDTLQIFKPDLYNEKIYKKSEIVVIITTSDRFSHINIAKELKKQNFQNILFHCFIDYTSEAYVITKVYNQLIDCTINNCDEFIDKKLPAIDTLLDILEDENAEKFISKEEDKITVYVPVILLYQKLFTLESEQFNIFCIYNIFAKLMSHFCTGVQNEKDITSLYNQFEIYRNNSEERALDRQTLLNSIVSRFNVFKSMDHLFNTDPLFFEKAPIEIKWNNKGFFYFLDGMNRAAFLHGKGKHLLPAQISKCDYELWYNKPILEELKFFLKENDIEVLRFPIPHPYFIHKPAIEESFSYKKIVLFLKWLELKSIDLQAQRIIDIQGKTGFFGEILSKNGANVTFLEEDEKYHRLSIIVNSLLYSNNIDSYHGSIEMHRSDYKYDIAIYSGIKIQSKNYETLQSIDSNTESILLVDIPIESDGIQFILKNSNFLDVNIIGTLAKEGVFNNICVFTKGIREPHEKQHI